MLIITIIIPIKTIITLVIQWNALEEMRETWSITFREAYDHRTGAVSENSKVRLLWNFNMQKYKVKEPRKPDLMLVDKECQIFDTAIPDNVPVCGNEDKKID